MPNTLTRRYGYDDVLTAIKQCDLSACSERNGHPQIAKEFERQVSNNLIQLGWIVTEQVKIADRGDGKPGFIDLVAKLGNVVVAIELDHTFPRAKSIRKLVTYEGANYRIIGLRKGHGALQLPIGIDALCTNKPPRCYGRKPA